MSTRDLEQAFSARIHESIQETRALNYFPTRFEHMLAEQSAVSLAKKLVKSGELQDGLKAVVKLGRKDLTMEAIMMEPAFEKLFSKAELQAAEWRLSQA